MIRYSESATGAQHEPPIPFQRQVKIIEHPYNKNLGPEDEMFPRRQIFSTSRRNLNQLRSPRLRTRVQRRYESTPSSELESAKDNAFIRERQAVKEHAAASAGEKPFSNDLP